MPHPIDQRRDEEVCHGYLSPLLLGTNSRLRPQLFFKSELVVHNDFELEKTRLPLWGNKD